MKEVRSQESFEWIDLFRPTQEELDEVARRYELDPAIAADLLSPTARHQVDFGGKHVYLVLHFPAFKDHETDAAYELDFVIGPHFLITVHYHEIKAFDRFTASLSPESGRDEIFFGILEALLADFDHKLAEVDHWVRRLEESMFSGKERSTIFEISEASRHLIDFKKITAVYPEVFKEFEEKGLALFGLSFTQKAAGLMEFYRRCEAKLELLSESVKELRETNDSLLTTRQNETMKILTYIVIASSILVGLVLIWEGLHL